MSIIPPGFAEVSLPFQHDELNRRAFCVFGVVVNGDPDPVALADSVVDAFDDTLRTNLDSNVTCGPALVAVGQDGGDPITGVGTLAVRGVSSYPDALNAGQSLLLRKGTALGGRRNRGRMFLPWSIADAEVNEIGLIDPDALAPRQANVTSFLSALETDILGGMVILHDDGQTEPGAPTPVTSLTVDRLVGSQRRRLGRRS